jgi:hypothetical protein
LAVLCGFSAMAAFDLDSSHGLKVTWIQITFHGSYWNKTGFLASPPFIQ